MGKLAKEANMTKMISILLTEEEITLIRAVLDRVPVNGKVQMHEMLKLMAKFEFAPPVEEAEQMELPLNDGQDEV